MDENNPLEARNWLKNNINKSPLAANQFGNKEASSKFIEQLYNSGAEEILVVDPTPRVKEGGEYTDSLKVKLPQDPQKRKAIFEIINSNIEEPDYAQEDSGQKELDLWWD